MHVKLLVRSLFAVAVCCAVLFGQTSTALLDGTVTDSSGALVPNASVVATNVDTGISSKVTTNSTRQYTFPQLPSGPYELSVSAAGFRDYVQRGIRLELGGKMRA